MSILKLEDMPDLLTTRQVAERYRYHVGPITVLKWAKRFLDFPIIRQGKRWVVRVDRLLEWEDRHAGRPEWE